MNQDIYRQVSLESIFPSPTNPRKSFPAEYIAELAQSIRARGIIQPLLVRTAAHGFDLIAGECRLRAAVIAELQGVPVIVRDDLTCNDVVELQLIENLQRRDLDVLEEAESYSQLLALEEGGSKRHTVATLAHAISKSEHYVIQRLKLMNLPEEGREALRSGTLSFTVARQIGRIPGERLRAEALKEVLHPKYEEDPLNSRQAAHLIRSRYMVDIKEAPFKKDDAELVPVVISPTGERLRGGACSDCPYLSSNAPDYEDVGSANLCTHPECYRAKLDAGWESVRMEALKSGKRVLSDAESEKVLNHSGTSLEWNTPYVELAAKVPFDQLAQSVKKQPSWKSLIKDVAVKPEIVVIRNSRGIPLEVVDRRQAIAAIKLEAKTNPKLSVLKGGSGSGEESSQAAERAAQRDKSKLATETIFEGMKSLRGAIIAHGCPAKYWRALLEIAISEAGADGLWLMAKWLEISADKSTVHSGRDYESALRASWKDLQGNELIAIVTLLFLSQHLKHMTSYYSVDSFFTSNFQQMGEVFSIDLEEIKKRVKADFAATKKAQKKKSKAS